MRRSLVLARKELASALNSPVAYAIMLFFLLASGIWFFLVYNFFAQNQASLRGYFGLYPLLFSFALPALTMRAWAEERKLGTDEVLFSLPYTEGELVAGKFLGGLAILLILAGLSLPVPLSLLHLGDFEPAQLAGEYLGLLLLGSTGLALGLFASSLSENQIIAYLSGTGLMVAFTFAHLLNAALGLPGPLAGLAAYFSLEAHYESFKRGVFDSRDALFFIVTTGLFLYLNGRVLAARKWR
jgi:ABC-2 type transport system permease protein